MTAQPRPTPFKAVCEAMTEAMLDDPWFAQATWKQVMTMAQAALDALAAEGYPVTAAGLAEVADPGVRLLPSESIALTVALAQVRRGEDPDLNVAGMCVLALARLTGRHDWTEEDR